MRNKFLKYLRQGTLISSMIFILRYGISAESKGILNEENALRIKRKLKKFYKKNKDVEFKKKLNNNKLLTEKKIIWTSWLQGVGNAPEIVETCINSMEKEFPEYRVIVLTEKNYSSYFNLPTFIEKKFRKGLISKAHFSDLLRAEALYLYGGVWVDATVFISGSKLIKNHIDDPIFLFQVLEPARKSKVVWLSNWFLIAKKDNLIIKEVRNLLLSYWETHDTLLDYFQFHYFLVLSLEEHKELYNQIAKMNNIAPHTLQFELGDPYSINRMKEIFELSDVHKLTYKIEISQSKLKNSNYNFLITHNI